MTVLTRAAAQRMQLLLRAGNLVLCRPVWGGSNIVCDYNKLYYVLDGEFIFEIGNKNYIVKPNQLVFIPENVRHTCRLTKKQHLYKYYVHFSATVDGMDLFRYLEIPPERYVVSFADGDSLTKSFQELFHFENYYDNTAKVIHQQAMLAEIIALYVEKCFSHGAMNARNRNKFKGILEYMEEHMSERVALEDLAKLLYSNPSYFIREFKATFGISPMAYFDTLRMEKSMHLLRETEQPITVIASAIGITDQAYFSRFFKNHAGISPTAYRQTFRE